MEFFLNYAYLIWVFWVFWVGASIGSLLNVCIARLPLEKSILWPSSRCSTCLCPIRWHDNLPIISYLRLGGRCRSCGQRFSARYMLVELGTGLGFAGLFLLVVVFNWYGHPDLARQLPRVRHGVIPVEAWGYFVHHALLFAFLLMASLCDLDRREIPLAITLPGTFLGLLSTTLHPWPWPESAAAVSTLPEATSWASLELAGKIPLGLVPWPVWGPLPDWLPAGSWQLGLATGLGGIVVALVLLRAVRFLAGAGMGKEALGLGDADLMMMVGSFLGWQLVLAGFFAGVLVTLALLLPVMIIRGLRGATEELTLPFGPGLALGSWLTWLVWPSLGPRLQFPLFDSFMLPVMAGVMAVMLFLLSLVFRRG